jgi:hypothetical protein
MPQKAVASQAGAAARAANIRFFMEPSGAEG